MMSTFTSPHSAVARTSTRAGDFSIDDHCVQMELMSMDIFSSLNKHNEAFVTELYTRNDSFGQVGRWC